MKVEGTHGYSVEQRDYARSSVHGVAEGPWPPALCPHEPLQEKLQREIWRAISSVLIYTKCMPFVQRVILGGGNNIHQDASRKAGKNVFHFKASLLCSKVEIFDKNVEGFQEFSENFWNMVGFFCS